LQGTAAGDIGQDRMQAANADPIGIASSLDFDPCVQVIGEFFGHVAASFGTYYLFAQKTTLIGAIRQNTRHQP
jgi:hypothetical protein